MTTVSASFHDVTPTDVAVDATGGLCLGSGGAAAAAQVHARGETPLERLRTLRGIARAIDAQADRHIKAIPPDLLPPLAQTVVGRVTVTTVSILGGNGRNHYETVAYDADFDNCLEPMHLAGLDDGDGIQVARTEADALAQHVAAVAHLRANAKADL